MDSIHNDIASDQQTICVNTQFKKLQIENEERKYIVDCYSCRKSFMIPSKKRGRNTLTVRKFECPNKCTQQKFVIRGSNRIKNVQKIRGPGRPELWIDRRGDIISPEARRQNQARLKGFGLKARIP